MTNIAMENPNHKWKFLAGKIIYFYGPSIPWQTVSHNQMVLKKNGYHGDLQIRPPRKCLVKQNLQEMPPSHGGIATTG